MSKKRIYTNIAITAPLITAIMAPQVAWADNTPTANTPATFAASDSSNANTPQNTTTRASDIIDENNTTVIELTATREVRTLQGCAGHRRRILRRTHPTKHAERSRTQSKGTRRSNA